MGNNKGIISEETPSLYLSPVEGERILSITKIFPSLLMSLISLRDISPPSQPSPIEGEGVISIANFFPLPRGERARVRVK